MKKFQLGDCCGARHIDNFYGGPDTRDQLAVYEPAGHLINVSVPGRVKLSLMSGRRGRVNVPGHPGHLYVNDAPGVMTCILRGDQHSEWKAELEANGWKLACNNIRNLNSYNRLYLWIKVNNPYTEQSWVFADGTVTSRNPGLSQSGQLRRVRHPITGQLETVRPSDNNRPALVV